jgi:hypothetical protein
MWSVPLPCSLCSLTRSCRPHRRPTALPHAHAPARPALRCVTPCRPVHQFAPPNWWLMEEVEVKTEWFAIDFDLKTWEQKLQSRIGNQWLDGALDWEPVHLLNGLEPLSNGPWWPWPPFFSHLLNTAASAPFHHALTSSDWLLRMRRCHHCHREKNWSWRCTTRTPMTSPTLPVSASSSPACTRPRWWS